MRFCDDAITVAGPRFGRPDVKKTRQIRVIRVEQGQYFRKSIFFAFFAHKKRWEVHQHLVRKNVEKTRGRSYASSEKHRAGPKKQTKNDGNKKTSILHLQTTLGTDTNFVKNTKNSVEHHITGSAILCNHHRMARQTSKNERRRKKHIFFAFSARRARGASFGANIQERRKK